MVGRTFFERKLIITYWLVSAIITCKKRADCGGVLFTVASFASHG